MNRGIDNLGRIVIPIEMRKKLGIKENDNLKIELKDNKIIISKDEEIKSKTVLDSFKQWLIDYRYKKTGSHEDGRYSVALSVTDILKKLDEMEKQNERRK